MAKECYILQTSFLIASYSMYQINYNKKRYNYISHPKWIFFLKEIIFYFAFLSFYLEHVTHHIFIYQALSLCNSKLLYWTHFTLISCLHISNLPSFAKKNSKLMKVNVPRLISFLFFFFFFCPPDIWNFAPTNPNPTRIAHLAMVGESPNRGVCVH